MAAFNITRFRPFVIIALLASGVASGAEDLGRPALFRFFLGASSAVQTTKVASAPALPQLRRGADIGLSFLPSASARAALSIGAFVVDPAIPAGAILYRGYQGFIARLAFDWNFAAENERETYPFVGIDATAALASYLLTDLSFLEYSISIAPGLASAIGPIAFRASIPLELDFRGDALSFSSGIRFILSRARVLPQRTAP